MSVGTRTDTRLGSTAQSGSTAPWLAATIGLLALGCADHAPGPGAVLGPVVEAQEVLTIRGAGVGEEYTFDRILDILVRNDEGVWILDGGVFGHAPLLRRYGPDGAFLGRVGRAGMGPGEYQRPYAMAELADGRVVVRDSGLTQRLTVFRADGAFDTIWTFSQPLEAIPGSAYTLQVDDDGFVWAQVTAGRPGPDRTGARRTAFVRITSSGEVLDTVWSPESPPAERDVITITVGPSTYGITVPYQPRAFSAWSRRGVFATGVTSRYVIEFHPVAGNPRTPIVPRLRLPTRISQAPPAVQVTQPEREALRTELVSRVAARGGSASSSVPEVPSEKPPLRSVEFDHDGRLWVMVSTRSVRKGPLPQTDEGVATSAPVRWEEPVAFDVYDPEGRFIARVRVPDASCQGGRGRSISDEVMWCVVRDDLDVEHVRKYRIRWP